MGVQKQFSLTLGVQRTLGHFFLIFDAGGIIHLGAFDIILGVPLDPEETMDYKISVPPNNFLILPLKGLLTFHLDILSGYNRSYVDLIEH